MIVDPSRSAAAAQKLFGGLGVDEPVYLVCDRYSAYKKLVRELPNHFVLAYCWVHVRRDFVNIGLGRPDMKPFGDWWVNRIGELCGRNAKRLQHWDSTANEQTAAFDEAQQELENDIETFFGQARQQIAILDAPQRKPLQSLLRHREGLEVFVNEPAVPMDNNLAERALRGPAIGRKLSFGSFSETGAQLAGLLFSVFGTLELAGLSPHHWLRDYLQVCAERNGQPPEDARAWLPWGAGRVRTWRAAAPQGP